MISYLSKPLVSTIQPFRENVELIASVAEKMQNRYDKVLTAIFEKENALLNLDTRWASEEITNEKNTLLKKADDDLNAMASLDFLNPENIKRAENIFSPIVNNKAINYGAAITKQINNNLETYEYWKKNKPELYNPGNEQHTIEKAYRNIKMSKDEFMENARTPNAIEYVDVDKYIKDHIKDIPADVRVEQGPRGGWIYKIKNEIVSKEKILSMMPTNDKILAQAEVNGAREFRNTPQEKLLDFQRSEISSLVNSYEDVNEALQTEIGNIQNKIKDVNANNDSGRKFLKNFKSKDEALQYLNAALNKYDSELLANKTASQEYVDKLNEFDRYYGYSQISETEGSYSTKLSDDQMDNLRTQIYWGAVKDQYANAFARKNVEQTITGANPYTFASYNNALSLQRMAAQFGYDMRKIDYSNALKFQSAVKLATLKGEIPLAGETKMFEPTPAKKESTWDKLKGKALGLIGMGDKYEKENLTEDVVKAGQQIGLQENGVIDETKSPVFNTNLLKFNERNGTNLSSNQFKQKVEDTRKISALSQGKDLDEIIPGSTSITFREYFKKNADIVNYIKENDQNLSNYYNAAALKQTMNERAENAVGSAPKINGKKTVLIYYNTFRNDPFKVVGNAWETVKNILTLNNLNADWETTEQPTTLKIKIPRGVSSNFITAYADSDKEQNPEDVAAVYYTNKDILKKYFNTAEEFGNSLRDVTMNVIKDVGQGFTVVDPESIEMANYQERKDDFINNELEEMTLKITEGGLALAGQFKGKPKGDAFENDMRNIIAADDVGLLGIKDKIQIGELVANDKDGYDIQYSYVEKTGAEPKTESVPIPSNYLAKYSIIRPKASNILNMLNMQKQLYQKTGEITIPKYSYFDSSSGDEYVFMMEGDDNFYLKYRSNPNDILSVPWDLEQERPDGRILSIQEGVDYIDSFYNFDSE